MKIFTLVIGHNVSADRNPTGTGPYPIKPETVRAAFDGAARLAGIDAYTIMLAEGVWKGQGEPSTVVLIATDDTLAVHRAVEIVRDSLSQESVMVIEQAATVMFI